MNTYATQPLHAFTNATCTSIVCYRRARVLVVKNGFPMADEFFCEPCAAEKIEAEKTLDMIEGGVVRECA